MFTFPNEYDQILPTLWQWWNYLLNMMEKNLFGQIQHKRVFLCFFKICWHLVAFIFTLLSFLQGYIAGCIICCFTTHSRQTRLHRTLQRDHYYSGCEKLPYKFNRIYRQNLVKNQLVNPKADNFYVLTKVPHCARVT